MHMSTRTINNVDMYADDSTITVCGKNIQEIELKLNNELQEISNWCDENRMGVNVEKNQDHDRQDPAKMAHLDKTNVNVCIKRDKLQMVENEWLLGLHVDNFLTGKAHIHNIHNTIAGKLALLCRIKQYLPYKARTTFYNSYILPRVDYCSTLWRNATTSDRIYKLQRRAARIITDSEYRAPSDPLSEQLNWLPLPERVKYRQSQLVYEAVNGLAPDYVCVVHTDLKHLDQNNSVK